MSNNITAPYPLFYDIDGTPLDAGFIFIGEEEKDPQTFPIPVYWDEAKTELVVQPIRTRNGSIVRDNVPAKVFIDELACSVATKNRNGYLVQNVSIFNPPSTAKGVKELIQAETDRATGVEAQLDNKISDVNTNLSSAITAETNRATLVEEDLQSQINSLGGGVYGFNTYAEFDAVKSTIPANSVITIGEPNNTGTGQWGQGENIWDGVTLKKSPYDPLTQAKKYTDDQVAVISANVDIKKANDPTIICMLADALGYAIVYYDKVKETFVGAGLLESIFELLAPLKKYQDGRYIPGQLDADGRMLWGWDTLLNRFVCGENFSSQQSRNYRYFPQKPIAAEINHMLSYGESLSVGATAVTILSTSQPYLNKTFGFVANSTTYASPRMDVTATSIQPLYETFYSPASDGGTNRGETHCSGAANYASLELLKNGVSPSNHVIFASTAGQGGATIAALARGGSAYARLLNHISKAKELNAGKTYKILFMPFHIGTNDAAAGTSYESFKTTFSQVYTNINTDVKTQTTQLEDLVLGVPQVSYGAKTNPQISKAVWDLTNENDKFLFVTPMYHFPYDADQTHLTNVGYKWLGAYQGRVYAQYFNEGRYPDRIKPLSAYIDGNQIIVKFDVPMWPLQIDTVTLAATTNAGFKVMNGSTELPITTNGVTAIDDTVVINLVNAPATNVQVRYALDYLGSGLIVKDGASGNLRDSTPDSIEIAGVSRPLYHLAPHFEITAYLDKGI